MNLKSRAIASLSWTLVAAIILGLVSCDTSSTSASSLQSSSGQSQRTARKYLELEDLNAGLSGPVAQLAQEYASGEEVTGAESQLVERHAKKHEKTKKVAKRSASDAPRVRQTRQQQLQQQRARTSRQNQNQKKQRPGFFWTLARVTFETFNDTKSAIQQISQILNDNIAPDPPVRKPTKKPIPGPKPVTQKPTAGPTSADGGNKTASLSATTQAPTTTTEAELKLTRPLLQSLVRRNVKGLVRLFNIEWRDALNQSQTNVQEFQRDLGKQIGMYLQDNPDAY